MSASDRSPFRRSARSRARAKNRQELHAGSARCPERQLGAARKRLPEPLSRAALLLACLTLAVSIGGRSWAQDAPLAPAPAPLAPAPAPVEAPPPSPPLPPLVEPAPTVAAEPMLEPQPVVTPEQDIRAAEPPHPVEEPLFAPKLTIGVGLRTGLSFAVNPGDAVTFSLGESLDQLMFRPFFAGQLTKKLGMFVQLNGGADGIDIIDAYFDLKLIDEFQVLIGQHIPANDRNNIAGPFFNNSWNFAAVHSFPFDAAGRDRGFTFWGLFAQGIIKYHLSLVELQPGREIGDARFAGRLNFNFLEPETSYYASETYFGKSDTLSVGAIVSYQDGSQSLMAANMDGAVANDKDGDGEVEDDFFALAADVLFEKNFGKGGTLTLSAMYWNWNGVGEDYVVNQGSRDVGKGFAGALSGNVTGQSYQVNVSWLSPTKLGIGQLQPNIRVQGFDEDAGDAMIYDVGLGYIIDGFNHLWRVNYRHVDNRGGGARMDEDSIQLGGQMQI